MSLNLNLLGEWVLKDVLLVVAVLCGVSVSI